MLWNLRSYKAALQKAPSESDILSTVKSQTVGTHFFKEMFGGLKARFRLVPRIPLVVCTAMTTWATTWMVDEAKRHLHERREFKSLLQRSLVTGQVNEFRRLYRRHERYPLKIPGLQPVPKLTDQDWFNFEVWAAALPNPEEALVMYKQVLLQHPSYAARALNWTAFHWALTNNNLPLMELMLNKAQPASFTNVMSPEETSVWRLISTHPQRDQIISIFQRTCRPYGDNEPFYPYRDHALAIAACLVPDKPTWNDIWSKWDCHSIHLRLRRSGSIFDCALPYLKTIQEVEKVIKWLDPCNDDVKERQLWPLYSIIQQGRLDLLKQWETSGQVPSSLQWIRDQERWLKHALTCHQDETAAFLLLSRNASTVPRSQLLKIYVEQGKQPPADVLCRVVEHMEKETRPRSLS